MASISQPPFFSSVTPVKKNTLAFSPQPKSFLTFKNSKISSSNSASSPNSQENSPESQLPEQDPIKLAFGRAKADKNSSQSSAPTLKILQSPLQQPYAETSGNDDDGTGIDEPKNGDEEKEVPLAVKIAMEKAKEYRKSKSLDKSKEAASKLVQNLGMGSGEKEAAPKSVQNLGMESAEIDEKKDGWKPDEGKDGEKEVPLAVKLALEKAREYKENKGVVDSDTGGIGGSKIFDSGLRGGNEKGPEDKQSIKDAGEKVEFSISSTDFMGLDFSDKKRGRGLPAGLVPLSDPFPEGDFPELEILVGDNSKFGDTSAASKPIPTNEDDVDLYKPKVSTWGVFPRPNNISKTYGGGRNIRPGEVLETAEEKAAKEARTRQLLAAYKTKIGLKIDPKLKSECEEALMEGDSLMDLGKLKEALPFYEKVMEKLVFETELHGLASLQWSICLDSLSRPNEARVMYEKLQSHPSPKVSKKARHFFFSFQAIEMMKVKSLSRSPMSTGYQNYFDAFVEDKTNYPFKEEAQVDEDGFNQTLPYVIFLLSPIVMMVLIAVSRSL